MDALIKWFRVRQSNIKDTLHFGHMPLTPIMDDDPLSSVIIRGIILGFIAAGITEFVGCYWLDNTYFKLSDWSTLVAAFVLFSVWLAPFKIFLSKLFSPKTKLDLSFWRYFTTGHRLLASGILTLLLLMIMEGVLPSLKPYLLKGISQWAPATQDIESPSKKKINKKTIKKPVNKNTPLMTEPNFWVYTWLPASLSLFGAMQLLSHRKRKIPITLKKLRPRILPCKKSTFNLWLGESTGWLAALGHPASLAPRQQIGLGLNDATQNILIMGAIGSGKTTRVINPLLLQLLDQDCGGLIFDIKGDFKKAVKEAADITNKQPTIIGTGQVSLNLLAGLTPEVASSFLKSALLLNGSGSLDSFWIDTATELCRNSLGILSFFPEHYTLQGLYQTLFDESFQVMLFQQCQNKTLGANEVRKLSGYRHYIQAIFARFDEKIRNGVLASVSQILSPFQHPALIDTFCTRAPGSISMESVLNGNVILVDMPLAQWGLAGKVVYTFIKLRFFNVMQQRAMREDWNQSRPVFFMCDEYQEIVSCNKDGLSDLNFWDKSRSSKTIGIISAQSISSFYAAIGNRDLAHALLQNFRQRLCFCVEDDWTVAYFNRLLGKVDVEHVSFTQNSGYSSRGLLESSYHQSSGETITTQQRDLIDGQLFRNLGANQVIAFLSIFGVSMDDVLNVQPVFIG